MTLSVGADQPNEEKRDLYPRFEFRARLLPALDSPNTWSSLDDPFFEPVRPDKITKLVLRSRANAGFRVKIGRDGLVKRVKVQHKSNSFRKEAEVEAVETIKSWKFHPARSKGRPIEWEVDIGIGVVDVRKGESVPAYPVLLVVPAYRPGFFLHSQAFAHESQVSIGTLPDGRNADKGSTSFARNRHHADFKIKNVVQILPDGVTFDLSLDEEGKVVSFEIMDAPYPMFVAAAIAAMKQSIFSPRTENGRAVPSNLKITLGYWGERRISQDGFVTLFEAVDHKGRKIPVTERPMIGLSAYASPVYSAELIAEKKNGKATAELILDETGKVARVLILDATTPECAQALSAAMATCRFQSLTGGNRPVDYSTFRLRRTEYFASYGIGNASFPSKTAILSLIDAKQPVVSSAALDRPLTSIFSSTPSFPISGESLPDVAYSVVEFVVDKSGRVCEPKIIECTAAEFGYAAVQAVSHWVYEPPLEGGAPVASRIQIRFEFLKNKEATFRIITI